jgi:hypothetical protein
MVFNATINNISVISWRSNIKVVMTNYLINNDNITYMYLIYILISITVCQIQWICIGETVFVSSACSAIEPPIHIREIKPLSDCFSNTYPLNLTYSYTFHIWNFYIKHIFQQKQFPLFPPSDPNKAIDIKLK